MISSPLGAIQGSLHNGSLAIPVLAAARLPLVVNSALLFGTSLSAVAAWNLCFRFYWKYPINKSFV